MSNAKKCDRCRKLYEFYDGYAVQNGGNKYDTLSLFHHWNTESRRYDLCPECMQSLIEWIKGVE